jgi:ATP-binding cassette subfamily F protein 3
VLDEPTNHLDVGSREALEEALENYEGTLVTVSHDRYLIEKLATRIIDMRPASLGGGFHDISITRKGEGYTELCRERERVALLSGESAETIVETVNSGKELYLKKKKETAAERNAQKRLERLRKEAEKIEAEIDAIDAEMSGDAAYDYVKLSELEEKKNALEERLLEIYEEI